MQFIENTGNKNIQQHGRDATSKLQKVGKSTENMTKFLQQIHHKAKNQVGWRNLQIMT